MNKAASHTKGFTLVELLLVLGVMALLILAAFVTYPNVQATQQVRAEAERAMIVVARLDDMTKHSWKTYGMDTEFFLNAGVIAEEDKEPSWGGSFEIHPANTGGSTGCAPGQCNRFALRYLNVPHNVCLKLVTAMEPYSSRVIVAPIGTNVNVKRLPSVRYDPGLAAQACSQGENGKVGLVQFNP
jgi:prepilin-type N-terminal cleavage/methylation domain-containing protein